MAYGKAIAALADPTRLQVFEKLRRGPAAVGTLAQGLKNGEPKTFYLYNVADHETVYEELGVQATAYQTVI